MNLRCYLQPSRCILGFVLLLSIVISQTHSQTRPLEIDRSESMEIKLEQFDDQVDVRVGGRLFTSLRLRSYAKPIFYPVYNPKQQSMTRSFPMKAGVPGEQADHPHHKSLWFAHDVDDVEFWLEKNSRIVVSGVTVQPKDCSLSWTGDWMNLKVGCRVCQDQTVVRFAADARARSIDYRVTVIASDRDIEFADSKEGSFAVRVHPQLQMETVPELRVKKVDATIENEKGLQGKAAWGKRAKWVKYSGAIDGEPASVVIFDHPQNLRHPTTWHTRGYGLFAANPFGLHHFEGKPLGKGKHELKQGERLTLRYQAIFFSVVPTRVEIEKRYEKFAASK